MVCDRAATWRTAPAAESVALEMVTGELHLLRSKAVIVATGGLGRLYEPSTNALICTGDGYSLAYRAGAPLMDMAMVQYHPTTLAGSGFLMTEAARGEGAYLLNSLGERFMKKYAPNKMELAARDVTSRAEATEIAEGPRHRRQRPARYAPSRPRRHPARSFRRFTRWRSTISAST